MVVIELGATSSLGVLSDLELLGGMLRKGKIRFFVLLEEDLSPFLKFHF